MDTHQQSRPDRRESSIEVEWLLSQSELDLTPVWVPERRQFRVIHACELKEPGKFVGADSIVLLTGLAFAKDPEAFREYGRHLVQCGVVGVGFGVGIIFEEVPEPLREICAQEGIVLFSVPLPIPFVAITAAVAREQERQRQVERSWLLEQQTRLNSAAHQGLDDVLEATSAALEATIAVVDSDARVLGFTSPADQVKVAELQEFVRTRGLGTAGVIRGYSVLSNRMQRSGERAFGMVVAGKNAFDASQRLLIRHSAGLADLLLQRPAALRRSRQEINSLAIAVQLGLEQDSTSIARVFHEAADARGEIRPILVASDSAAAHRKVLSNFDLVMEVASRLVYALSLDELSTVILVRGERSISGIRQLFSPCLGRSRAVVGAPISWTSLDMEVVDRLRYYILGTAPGEISGTRSGFVEWARSPEIGHSLLGRRSETWGRLEELDAVNGTALAETLAAFLRTNGHASDTSKYLGVHRQTLAKRVREIESALEMDLANPLVRAELVISMVAGNGA